MEQSMYRKIDLISQKVKELTSILSLIKLTLYQQPVLGFVPSKHPKSDIKEGTDKVEKIIKGQIDIINQKIKELNSIYHAAAGKAGISDGEICIWSALLNSEQEYSQQDLCDQLFLPRQTVNSIVSNLVKRGFVYLEHVPGTRNRKVICLTEEGRTYGNEQIMWIFQAEQEAMEGTDPQEVQATILMIEKYIARLREKLRVE